MIEAEYRRDPDHNFMIPQIPIREEEGYILQMLAENDIPGLLPVKLEKMNGKQTICYEITSRQPLETMFARQGMERRDVVSVMQAVLLAGESAKAYLLNPADLVFLPAMMYMEPDSRQVSLCYLPGYGQREESRTELAEFMIRHLSHQDRGAVDLAYGFYEKISRENAGLTEVIGDLLRREKSSIEKAQKEEPSRSGSTESREDRQREGSKRADTEDEPWEDEEWLAEINGEREDPGNRKAKKRKQREKKQKAAKAQKKSQRAVRNRAERRLAGQKRKYILWGSIGVSCLIVYVLLSWLCRFDLTRMGGLAFLMISVIWLTYSAVTGRRQKNRNHWLEDVGDSEEEEAYMQQLMSEVYADVDEDQEEQEFSDIAGRTNHKEEDHYGQTRMLRVGHAQDVVLVSENLRYPNLKPVGEICLIGKQAQRVDLVLPMHDSLSRIHAKLECTQEGVFITDMNSTNGTKINGNLISDRSRLHPGDHVSFASFSYQVRFAEEQHH